MPIRCHTLRMPVRLGSTTFPIRRCAKGRGFSYYAVGGKRTSDQATLQRIRSLGGVAGLDGSVDLPPQW
jgi:DNA topoisomerase IB